MSPARAGPARACLHQGHPGSWRVSPSAPVIVVGKRVLRLVALWARSRLKMREDQGYTK